MLYLIVRDIHPGVNNHVQITSDKDRAQDLADDNSDIVIAHTVTPLDHAVWDHMMFNYSNFILPMRSLPEEDDQLDKDLVEQHVKNMFDNT